MKLLDEKFKDHKTRYVAQSTLAMLAMFAILNSINAEENAAIVGALGASSFIVFVLPETRNAEARYLLGGYTVGIACGCVFHFLAVLAGTLPLFEHPPTLLCAAAAVGCAIFIMVVTNTEHPPAAGVALGLVLNELSPTSVAVVIAGIVSLVVLRALLRPMLINLL